MNRVTLSSQRSDWETPHRFFDALNAEFGFTLDACASDETAKCATYFTPDNDALSQPWDGVVYCNPPYGYQIGKWVAKCHWEARRGSIVVGLIPAKTETRWWHEHVMAANEIRLIRGRLRFSGSQVNAPFPSAVVVWRPDVSAVRFTTMDRILDVVGAA